MKHVAFSRISIKNFLSVGTEPVVVEFKPGLHIITGVNKDKQDRRNGVGKSTVADAINFAIFGSTIRDIKKENIVNHVIGKGCEVTLEFSVKDGEQINDYKVVRMLEPSKCYLYINDNDETRDTIANTTEFICKVLNTSQEVFQNSVIMTINNTIPFMGKKKVEKRKFIEGIFNLEVFSKMLTQLRAEHNEVKKDFEVESGRYEEAEKSHATSIQSKDKFIASRENKKEQAIQRQKSNTDEIEKIESTVFQTDEEEISKLKKSIATAEDNIDSCDEKINNINKQISAHEAEVKFKAQTVAKIGTDEDTCPMCLKPVTDHDREHIDAEIAAVKKDIEELRADIATAKTNLSTVNDLKGVLRASKTNQSNLLNEHVVKIKESEQNKKRLTQLHEWNKQLSQDMEQFDSETGQFDEAIKQAEERLQELLKKIDSIKHTLSILDVVKFIVSEEGVKSYIVKKILQVFNGKLAYYLRRMDANCICMFNEYFEEEIVDEKGNMCSYFNFSGAERKNIDLACLFAFMDIRRLQGNVAYNFSVYDELLDSSLDEHGVHLVIDILRERVEKYNECIMVISHRKESVNIGSDYKNSGEVIFLEKHKGITRRVEFVD